MIRQVASNPIAQLASALSSPEAGQSASGVSGAAQAAVSGTGQLLGKLTRLKQAAPGEFEEVVSGMATTLRAAAQKDSGASGRFLNELAGKLEEVARGGDISTLTPPAGGASMPPPSAASLHAVRSYRANSVVPPPQAPGPGDTAQVAKEALAQSLAQLQSALSRTVPAT